MRQRFAHRQMLDSSYVRICICSPEAVAATLSPTPILALPLPLYSRTAQQDPLLSNSGRSSLSLALSQSERERERAARLCAARESIALTHSTPSENPRGGGLGSAGSGKGASPPSLSLSVRLTLLRMWTIGRRRRGRRREGRAGVVGGEGRQ